MVCLADDSIINHPDSHLDPINCVQPTEQCNQQQKFTNALILDPRRKNAPSRSPTQVHTSVFLDRRPETAAPGGHGDANIARLTPGCLFSSAPRRPPAIICLSVPSVHSDTINN